MSHLNKTQISIHDVQPIPQDVHQLVSLLHNSSHYVVLEINIPWRIFKIYDGLSRELLQWMDHIVLALKRCMLLNVSYASSNTIIHSRCCSTTGCIIQQVTREIHQWLFNYLSLVSTVSQDLSTMATREGLLHPTEWWIKLWTQYMPQINGNIWHYFYPRATGILRQK